MAPSPRLITFGFTPYEVFHSVEQLQPQEPTPFGARELGLALTSLGPISLALAMWQHHRMRATMRRLGPLPKRSPAVPTAAAIVLVGLIVVAAALAQQ